jgi:hypothetical protein
MHKDLYRIKEYIDDLGKAFLQKVKEVYPVGTVLTFRGMSKNQRVEVARGCVRGTSYHDAEIFVKNPDTNHFFWIKVSNILN